MGNLKGRSGERIRLPDEVKEHFEQLIENSGFLQPLRTASEAKILERALGTCRQGTAQVELFDFAEKAFELGHALVNLRNRVNSECGTFRSLIRNLFRTVDYRAFVEAAEKLRDSIQELRENIAVLIEPSGDTELEFNRRLTSHVDALFRAVDLTLRKFRYMAQNAESAHTGLAWERWQKVVRDEVTILEGCDSSGKALTRIYHQFREER